MQYKKKKEKKMQASITNVSLAKVN